MTFKLSGRARDMNTTPKYTPVERAPKTYDDGNDFSLESRAGKRKFDQTKTPAKGAADDESGVKDEPLNETAEEVQTSPKKKSLVQEEVAEVQSEVATVQEEAPPTTPKKKKKRQSSAVEAEVAPPEEPQPEEAAAAEGEMSAKKKKRKSKSIG